MATSQPIVGVALFAFTAMIVGTQARPATVHAQTAISGSWQSAAASGWTLVLRAEGTKLTGAVSNCTAFDNVEISEGRLDGDTLRFSCRSADGDRTLSFIGQVSGSEITLTWTLHVRAGGVPLDPSDTFAPPVPGFERYAAPTQFTVKRVADGVGEVVLSRIAERIRTTRLPFSPVTFDRILRSTDEPANWLTYSGDLLGTRHSSLLDLTPANVADLHDQAGRATPPAPVVQANTPHAFSAVPLQLIRAG